MKITHLIPIILCVVCLPRHEAQAQQTQIATQSTERMDTPSATLTKATTPIERAIVTPKDQLPPLRSVRIRDEREMESRSREGTIIVRVRSTPPGARVTYGGKLLGVTPLTLKAKSCSPPLDVLVRHPGHMNLRTRLHQNQNRTYDFKLSPAKIR